MSGWSGRSAQTGACCTARDRRGSMRVCVCVCKREGLSVYCNMCEYVWDCLFMCVCVCVCLYVCLRDRERKRERDSVHASMIHPSDSI